MKKSKLLLALVLGIFIVLQSCEKKELKPEKELSKLEYLKQLTGSDNFKKIKSADKSNNDILDSLNWSLYRYYQDENNKNLYQDIIINEDGKPADDLVNTWWIEIKSIGTLTVHSINGNVASIECTGIPTDCMNILFFGNEHILF